MSGLRLNVTFRTPAVLHERFLKQYNGKQEQARRDGARKQYDWKTLMALPLTYVDVDVAHAQAGEVEIESVKVKVEVLRTQVYFDTTAEPVVNNIENEVKYERQLLPAAAGAKKESGEQLMRLTMQSAKDEFASFAGGSVDRANWGRMHLVAGDGLCQDGDTKQRSTPVCSRMVKALVTPDVDAVRRQFAQGAFIAEAGEQTKAEASSNRIRNTYANTVPGLGVDSLMTAAALVFESPAPGASGRFPFVFAYEERVAIRYFEWDLAPYWTALPVADTQDNKGISGGFDSLLSAFASAAPNSDGERLRNELCSEYDAFFSAEARYSAGADSDTARKYERLLSLAHRQVTGATKLVANNVKKVKVKVDGSDTTTLT